MTTTLAPVCSLADKARIPFPGASDAYADARRALLAEEIEARRLLTRIAEHRRALPPGPVVEKDYQFRDGNGEEVGLADLFGDKGHAGHVFLDVWPPARSAVPDVHQLAGRGERQCRRHRPARCAQDSRPLAGRAPARVRAGAGLAGPRLVQTIGDEWATDLGLLQDDGSEWPGLYVFRRDGDAVRLFWSSAQSMDTADPGQDPRDAPDIASLWSILDLTPEGRPADWYPKLNY